MRRRAFIVALGGRSGVANRCPRSSWKYFFAAPKGGLACRTALQA